MDDISTKKNKLTKNVKILRENAKPQNYTLIAINKQGQKPVDITLSSGKAPTCNRRF